jgi:hypothetical protein
VIPPGTDPSAVDRFGTTASEQARGEGLSERLSEERPDGGSPDGGYPDGGDRDREDVGQLTQEGDAETDREAALVARRAS